MTTVNDVPPNQLLEVVSKKLREYDAIKPPAWAEYATTGIHREKPPVQEDWWHTRAAAVLRKVYLHGPIGSERMRTLFGGARDRGSRPNRAKAGSGSVAREVLQQLEAAKLVETVKGKGRRVSPAGQSLLDNSAFEAKKKLVEEVPGLAKY